MLLVYFKSGVTDNIHFKFAWQGLFLDCQVTKNVR